MTGAVPKMWFTRCVCAVTRCKIVALHRIDRLRDIISMSMIEANTAHTRVATYNYF